VITRALVLVLALARVAQADPAKDRAALGEFGAAYRATAALSGAARTDQACVDAAKLNAAGTAFSSETAPADAPVDNETWASAAGSLVVALHELTQVCKTPDRKLRLLGPDVKTADQVVAELDKAVQRVMNTARPRTLPAGLKAARAPIAAMRSSSKSICTQQPKLMKALAQVKQPPAGVAAPAWNELVQTVKNIADDLRPGACGKHRAADEQIGSALNELHDHFYELVLLVPPR